MTSSPDLWSPYVPQTAPAAAIPLPAWPPPLATESEQRAELDRQQREAFQRGADTALRQERARTDERCKTALAAVARAASHLELLADVYARDRERDLHALALAVARHVVQRELATDPELVGTLVRRALDLVPVEETVELRVHPDDLELLAPSIEAAQPGTGRLHVELRPDPTLERGGFVIVTPHRLVDGRSDVALRALYDRLDHD